MLFKNLKNEDKFDNSVVLGRITSMWDFRGRKFLLHGGRHGLPGSGFGAHELWTDSLLDRRHGPLLLPRCVLIPWSHPSWFVPLNTVFVWFSANLIQLYLCMTFFVPFVPLYSIKLNTLPTWNSNQVWYFLYIFKKSFVPLYHTRFFHLAFSFSSNVLSH